MSQADLYEYLNENNIGHFEGERGVRTLTKVIKDVCGYNDPFSNSLHEFFADNSGAIEAVLNWIADQNVPEWNENMQIEDDPEFDAEDIEWQENYMDQQRDSLINDDEDIPGC